ISGNSPARRGRMGRYVRRRRVPMVPLLFGISLLIFLIIQAAPGGPEAIFLENRLFIDPQVIDAFRQRLGLDQPVPVQYVRWLLAVLSGDFGISFSTGRPVGEMILERLPAALELMSVSFVLSIRHIAGWSRYMRSSLLDVIRADFIRTARSKGLRERVVLTRHAVKNALIPVVSIMALDLAGLFSGAVIAETIFAWPGIGRLFVQAMFSRDYPLLMGILMMSSFLVVFFNLIADVAYGWLDPRISYK